MTDILGFDPLIVVKIIILIFIALVGVISFIFAYQVRSLNRVITILTSFSSSIIQILAIIYFLSIISLFFFTLVIL